MPVHWNEDVHNDFYEGVIGWADPDDPANVNGERIGEIIHYGKDYARYAERGPLPHWFYRKRARQILKKLINQGLTPAHRMLEVGCSFGFMAYAMRTASIDSEIGVDFPLVYGLDVSSYIEDNYAAECLGDEPWVCDDFLNIDKQRVKNKLISMSGHSTFHVILNYVIESFDPVAEATEFNAWLDLCELGLVGTDYRRVIHLVGNTLLEGETASDDWQFSTLITYGMTLQTLAEWSALRPTHSWYSWRDGEYIMGQ